MWLRDRLRSPLFWLLVAVAVVRAVGLTWGLPASDGWDDDGIAPRDFLVGVVETFTPGSYFTYPPVHLLLLALLNAPFAIVALLRAPSLSPHDVVSTFIQVPTMTAFAIVARLVSLAMSLGIVATLAKIGEEVRSKRAGLWMAACAAVNATLTYYAHTTNLDVPYLFWAFLSILFVARAIVRGAPRLLRRAAVFAALAVGTKDQAYAVLLLSLPTALVAWAAWDPAMRARRGEIARETGIAAAIAVGLLALVDGAILNPTGFAARVHFLLGPASQDHAEYAKGLHGALLLMRDALEHFDWFYPLVFAPFVLAGVPLAWRERRAAPARAIAATLPLLAALSFTLAFNFTARRSEHRFLLPQSIAIAAYAGLAFDAAFEWLATRVHRAPAQLAAAACFAPAVYACLAVDATLLGDARYDAEAWLAANVAPGEVVETYGNNVYLPRFPAGERVVRVGPDPIGKRSPLPNVTEVVGAYEDAAARGARWIVVSEGWVWRYTLPWEEIAGGGTALSAVQRGVAGDRASRAFFGDIHAGRGGWRRAHTSRVESRWFPTIGVHASTGCEIRIFRRDD
jgi:4-amino-4-deoxy-L-arabinose transferase-like glycosyltransferase